MTEREAGELAGKLKMLAATNRLSIMLLMGSRLMTAGELEAEVGKRIGRDLALLTLAGLLERGLYCGPRSRYSLTAEGRQFRDVLQQLIEEKRRREHEASPPLAPRAEIAAGEAEGPGNAADAGGLHPPQ